MLIDTMIPEALEESRALARLVALTGFLCAFALSKHDEPNPPEPGDAERCAARDATPPPSTPESLLSA